jgi:hypothetical protein
MNFNAKIMDELIDEAREVVAGEVEKLTAAGDTRGEAIKQIRGELNEIVDGVIPVYDHDLISILLVFSSKNSGRMELDEIMAEQRPGNFSEMLKIAGMAAFNQIHGEADRFLDEIEEEA